MDDPGKLRIPTRIRGERFLAGVYTRGHVEGRPDVRPIEEPHPPGHGAQPTPNVLCSGCNQSGPSSVFSLMSLCSDDYVTGVDRVAVDSMSARIQEYFDRDYARQVAGLSLVCGSRGVAEDSVQEALARAWEQEWRGEHIDVLTAWVAAVATNLARSYFRRQSVEIRARFRGNARDRPKTDEAGQVDRRVDLLHAISLLPKRQREALFLRYFEDLDMTSISECLNMNEGAVKTLLFRARRSLAEILKAPDDGSAYERDEREAEE